MVIFGFMEVVLVIQEATVCVVVTLDLHVLRYAQEMYQLVHIRVRVSVLKTDMAAEVCVLTMVQ